MMTRLTAAKASSWSWVTKRVTTFSLDRMAFGSLTWGVTWGVEGVTVSSILSPGKMEGPLYAVYFYFTFYELQFNIYHKL